MKAAGAFARPILVGALLFFLFPGWSFAQQRFPGTIRQISDGDTATIATRDGRISCRLYGIDAPETSKRGKPGQPYGEEAKAALAEMIKGQTVDVETTGAKTYRREVCLIRKDGQDVNLAMVQKGYAWAYVEYLKRPHASIYINAEREARRQRLGLWQDVNPMGVPQAPPAVTAHLSRSRWVSNTAPGPPPVVLTPAPHPW